MPLILLFAASNQSLDIIANSELIALEIVRTLCGSIGLVAAVPITTALAAAVLRPDSEDEESATDNGTTPDAKPDQRPAAQTLIVEMPPAEPETPPGPEPRWEDFAPVEEP